MSTALTKKQQKAQAFRAKQKAKKSGKEDVIPADIPEQDPIDDEDVPDKDDATIAESSKTRKREEAEGAEMGGSTTAAKGKGKAKTAWDDEDGLGQPVKKSKKEIKQRFILFVGEYFFSDLPASRCRWMVLTK